MAEDRIQELPGKPDDIYNECTGKIEIPTSHIEIRYWGEVQKPDDVSIECKSTLATIIMVLQEIQEVGGFESPLVKTTPNKTDLYKVAKALILIDGINAVEVITSGYTYASIAPTIMAHVGRQGVVLYKNWP